jgi:hypothetical protein
VQKIDNVIPNNSRDLEVDKGTYHAFVPAKNEVAFVPGHQKRLYDRHSGTGRGKEIAKGGAGGKYTWGTNPKELALEYTKHYDVKDAEAGENCKFKV